MRKSNKPKYSENNIKRIEDTLNELFPINRSLTGPGNRKTFDYIKSKFLPTSIIKSISSGTKVYDWEIPEEWSVSKAYVKNKNGEKIIDICDNNIHLVSYSKSVNLILSKEELIKNLHTLPKYPQWIPYRTSYYSSNWGFCCSQDLINSEKFEGPFEVKIESKFNPDGVLNWLECLKPGEIEDEILISTYCCHPSLANDNLSGLVAAIFLFKYLLDFDTKYSYRLVIAPETIGTISFLSQANTINLVGGMILSCVAGPDKLSIKEGFDNQHWINKAAIHAINDKTEGDFITYPFVPDGSDERQYSTPGFKIVTPSIHKSKYYEYKEYHTSADNLDFISASNLNETLEVYKQWVNNIESYCYPKRINNFCEFQLGNYDLYPNIGGTLNQSAHIENTFGNHNRKFSFNNKVVINGAHLEAFNWLMHLSNGENSNFDIAKRSGLSLELVNEAISAFYQKKLVILK